jgi:hypothetical protein
MCPIDIIQFGVLRPSLFVSPSSHIHWNSSSRQLRFCIHSHCNPSSQHYQRIWCVCFYLYQRWLLIAYPFDILVVIIDPGFATHGVHMDQRVVKLVSVLSADKKTLTVTGPPNNKIYPPGEPLLLSHSMYNNHDFFIVPQDLPISTSSLPPAYRASDTRRLLGLVQRHLLMLLHLRSESRPVERVVCVANLK